MKGNEDSLKTTTTRYISYYYCYICIVYHTAELPPTGTYLILHHHFIVYSQSIYNAGRPTASTGVASETKPLSTSKQSTQIRATYLTIIIIIKYGKMESQL